MNENVLHVLQGCIALYLKTLTKQFVKFKFVVKRALMKGDSIKANFRLQFTLISLNL